jgi:homoserine O-acetyltransferase
MTREFNLQSGAVTLRDFVFHDGSRLPELTINYRTLGTPRRDGSGAIENAILLHHGTGGSGGNFLAPALIDAFFGPGAPLDASIHYVILPDAIGHGGSSKPSDGLRMAFPAYDYADMVEAEMTLVRDTLGIAKLKAVMGISMGGMVTFQWATTYPESAQKFLPMGCYPIEIAGQNRLQRKLIIDAIKLDPAWNEGNYTSQPVAGMRGATSIAMLMASGALYLQTSYPTREAADKFAEEAMALSLSSGRDANDAIYQTDASRNYNPWDRLDRMTAPVLWINFADDLLNPPALGVAEKAVARMPDARFVLVPGTEKTRGHGTLNQPEYWGEEVAAFLRK